MRLRTADNKKSFYQWDTGQVLILEGETACEEIHMSQEKTSQAMACRIRQENNQRVVDVPDVLLQTADTIFVYLPENQGSGIRTRYAQSFPVIPRPKPENYGGGMTGGLADEQTQLILLVEADLLPAVCDGNGRLLSDGNGNVILRY